MFGIAWPDPYCACDAHFCPAVWDLRACNVLNIALRQRTGPGTKRVGCRSVNAQRERKGKEENRIQGKYEEGIIASASSRQKDAMEGATEDTQNNKTEKNEQGERKQNKKDNKGVTETRTAIQPDSCYVVRIQGLYVLCTFTRQQCQLVFRSCCTRCVTERIVLRKRY